MSRSKPKDPWFPGMPPIVRLHRDVIITEKINGTNGLIAIKALDQLTGDQAEPETHWPDPLMISHSDRNGLDKFAIWAGSKNQWLGPDGDNFGFGAWVLKNGEALISLLGPGLHRGEWWGSGVQTGYGLPKGEKRFSLFNTTRWCSTRNFTDPMVSCEGTTLIPDAAVPGLSVVPVLAQVPGQALNYAVNQALDRLQIDGSQAAPGFMRPEGVVIFQPSTLVTFKATLENDEVPKSLVRNV